MNIKALSLICCLAVGMGLPLSFAYVMGPDDRAEVSEAEMEISAIRQTGMIRIHGEEFVSGLLTGKNCDVVITAGHAAVYWQNIARKGWRKGEVRGGGNYLFNLNPDIGDQWQSMSLVASGYELSDNVGKDEHDWSIFRTSSAVVSDCKIQKVVARKVDCKGDLVMPGFHFDRPGEKLLGQNCEVKRSIDNGVIVHDCDSKDGSSGAPLFCRDNGSLTLLAINISGQTHKDYYDSGVYGKSGRAYHDRKHKNFAISIGGEFYRALQKEMKASAARQSALQMEK